jgi:hypothetical protein
MKNWRKKFAVIVLLLLPLQGLAATSSAFTCFSADAHHAVGVDAHSHDGHFSHDRDDDTRKEHSGHLGCHHFFSAMPAAMAVTVPSELPAFQSSISLLFTLFVPERPQRPPRS